METRLALVIVVDGLRASALGAYGNTTFPTPNFDSLASRAVVAEWLLADSPKLSDYYRAVWCGLHYAENPHEETKHCLPKILQKSQVRSWLLTDDPCVADQAEKVGFTQVILFESPVAVSAAKIEETHFALFFSHALKQLNHWQKEVAENNEHGIVWVHLRGLTGPWDAPFDMRTRLLDEEDPTPLRFIEPPAQLQIGDDPDGLLSYQVGYAAQVELLDLCIRGFFDAFETLKSSAPRITILTSSRGFALGEHGVIGHGVAELYSEQLHLPWLLLVSGNEIPLPRVGGFAQPVDIGTTLLDWFGIENSAPVSAESLLQFLSGEAGELRQLALARNPAGQRMIRTPAWMLQTSLREGAEKLFVKPDDRWEVNDVASRCREIVEQLRQLLTECLNCDENCINLRTIELPEELVSPQR